MPVQLIIVVKGAKRVVSWGIVAMAMSPERREMLAFLYDCSSACLGESLLVIVEGRRRRVMVVLLRDGWVVRLLRTWVPSSPAPRTRIEEEGDIVVAGACLGI